MPLPTPLAPLRRSALARDDSGPSRVYRDAAGNVFHSVTSILSVTRDNSGLEQWANRLDSFYGAGAAEQERNTAATRGTQAHGQAEYLLKTALRVARSTANKRNCLRVDSYGLPHIPTDVWRWSVGRCMPRLPPVSLSAKGYARGLTEWIASNVVQCHAAEFSVSYPYAIQAGGTTTPFTTPPPPCSLPAGTVGLAGTADALVSLSGACLVQHGLPADLTGAPFIADWKTSANRRSEATLHDYYLQCGAYALGLEYLTGIQPAGAVVVVARRVGPPNVYMLDVERLQWARRAFLARCSEFFGVVDHAVDRTT